MTDSMLKGPSSLCATISMASVTTVGRRKKKGGERGGEAEVQRDTYLAGKHNFHRCKNSLIFMETYSAHFQAHHFILGDY